jgi:hypothetical protein
MEEREDRPAEEMNYTVASMAGGEESHRRNPIGCFRPPLDMRSVPHERETRCKLTEVENIDGVRSKTVWCSRWRMALNYKDSMMMGK